MPAMQSLQSHGIQCVAMCCSVLQCVAVCCRHSLVGRLCRICIATESAGLCLSQCARKSRARVCPECITTHSYTCGMTHSYIMLRRIHMSCYDSFRTAGSLSARNSFICGMTHQRYSRSASRCITTLSYICDMTHS